MMRVLGCCSLAFYCILSGLFWNNFTSTATRADDATVFVAAAALVIIYFYGRRWAKNVSTVLIVGFALAFALVGVFIVPFDSTDVFFYMATGWQQAHYANNPYSTSLRDISEILDDPMVQNEWMARNRNPWLDLPLPYGFLFALISKGIAWIGHGNLWMTLGLFTLLNLITHVGTAYLLWEAARLIPGANANSVLYLYSWNPFVLLQYLGNLHNDILVGFLVVLAAYLLLSGRLLWVIPALVASVLIKHVTVVLLPFALIFLIGSGGWKAAFRSLCLSAGIVLVSTLPYLGDITAFRYELIVAQVSESTGSLHAFMLYTYRILGQIWPALLHTLPHFRTTTQIGLWIIFAGFVIHEIHMTWWDTSLSPVLMIQRWTAVLFGLIFVASSQFFAWYLGMLFPLALLTTERKSVLADIIVLLSGGHMLSFTFVRRKAIGYFLLATVMPIVYVTVRRWWLKTQPSVQPVPAGPARVC
jgi:hypothetical protein